MGLLDSNKSVYAEKVTEITGASLQNTGYVPGANALSAQGYNTAIIYISTSGVKFEIYGDVKSSGWGRIKYYNAKGEKLTSITESGYYYVDISNVKGFGIVNNAATDTTCNITIYYKQTLISDIISLDTVAGNTTLAISTVKTYLVIEAPNKWVRVTMTVPSNLDSGFSIALTNNVDGLSFCYSDRGEILQYITKEEFAKDSKRSFYMYVNTNLSIYNTKDITETSVTIDYGECDEPAHILSMKPVQAIIRTSVKGVVGAQYSKNIESIFSTKIWNMFKYVFVSAQLRNSSNQLITTEKNLQIFPLIGSTTDVGNHLKNTPDSVIMEWSYPKSNNGIVTPYIEHTGTHGYRFVLASSTPIVEGDYAEVIIWGVR